VFPTAPVIRSMCGPDLAKTPRSVGLQRSAACTRLDRVDLSKIDEVGFTDLLPGSGHGDGGYSDLGWIEVYGVPIPRAVTEKTGQ
jgi:hypothetical protein